MRVSCSLLCPRSHPLFVHSNTDKYQNGAENEELNRLKDWYELNETIQGNVWKELDDVVEATGASLRDKIKVLPKPQTVKAEVVVSSDFFFALSLVVTLWWCPSRT